MKKVIALHTHAGNDNNNQPQMMTSLEIAELTGKQHFHVMEAIRKMEPAWVKVNESKFRLVTYKDQKGELRPCYQLTKTECLYIATKFNDEARAKLVLRWEELERAHRGLSCVMPITQPEPSSECRQLPSPKEILRLADNIIGKGLRMLNAASPPCARTSVIH